MRLLLRCLLFPLGFVLVTEGRQYQLTKPDSTSTTDEAALPYPHFAGVPCAADGVCPTGPNCTICGNYCGPGWCGGACVAEGPACDYSVPSQEGSCTDACCKVHDMCCGCEDEWDSPFSDCDRTGCNRALADCLSTCSWSDDVPGRKDCSGPDGSWGPKLIEFIFFAGQRECCGSRCHTVNKTGTMEPIGQA